MDYVVAPAALADLEHAVVWLREHRTAELANVLLRGVEHAIGEIAEHPTAWPVWSHDTRFRVRHLPRLRYSIFYRVTDRVEILAITHMKRRPGSWLK